jgi:hypothetical protein
VLKMMGRLFKSCLGDESGGSVPAAVHDRALLYYRLLRTDVTQAAAVIGGEVPPVDAYTEDQPTPADAAVWAEFNTLSVVYGKPSEMFIQADHLIKDLTGAGAAAKAAAAGAAAKPPSDSDDSLLLGGGGGDDGVGGAPGGAAAAPPASAGGYAVEEDLLGLSMGPPAPAPAAASAYAAPPVPALSSSAAAAGMPPAPTPGGAFLVPGAVLAPDAFQAKWGALGGGQALALRAGRLPTTAEVEALARAGSLYTIASGDVGTHLKFYLYGRDASGAYALLEVVLDKSNGGITATLKCDNPAAAPAVAQALAAALRPILAA